MSHSRGFCLLLLMIMVFSASSCSIPSTTVLPTPTQTTFPIAPPTSTTTPTSEPSLAETPAPTNSPVATPISLNLYLPVGIVTLPSAGSQLAFYDLQGKLLGERQTPNFGTGSFLPIHIAGPLTFTPDPILPPIVYFVYDNGGELWLNDNNNLSLIKAAPGLYSILGVPGKPIMSYTTVENVDSGVRTRIYLGDLQTLPTASSIIDSTSNKSYATKPLAITLKDGQPAGIWYTTVLYGIGDLVFEPRSSLYFLDLSTYSSKGYLDTTKNPSGLSDDQSWIAYTATDGNGPLNIAHNFDLSSAITFPLIEGNDQGAGDAVFSPDNQYIAWREASGNPTESPADFHETIRIADTAGNIITDLPDTALLPVSSFNEISWVIPVGWLDSQTLVLQVTASKWDNACLISVKFDGSALTYLAPGLSLGFLYP